MKFTSLLLLALVALAPAVEAQTAPTQRIRAATAEITAAVDQLEAVPPAPPAPDLAAALAELTGRVQALEARPTGGAGGPTFATLKAALDYAMQSHGQVDLNWAVFTGPVTHVVSGIQKPWGVRNFFLRAPPGHTGPLLTIVNQIAAGAQTANSSGFQLADATLEGGGLLIQNTSGNLYQFVIERVRVRDVKGHGFHFRGGFEGRIWTPFVEGASGDGLRFESQGQGGGLVSAIDVFAPDIRFAQVGINLVMPTRDVAVFGGYLGHNRGPAIVIANGTDRQWQSVSTESNNTTALPAVALAGGELEAGNGVNIAGFSFGMLRGGSKAAVIVRNRAGPVVIRDSRRTTSGRSDGLEGQTVGFVDMGAAAGQAPPAPLLEGNARLP